MSFQIVYFLLNILLSGANEYESSMSGTQTVSHVHLKFITTMQYMIPLFCYVHLIIYPVIMEKKRKYKIKRLAMQKTDTIKYESSIRFSPWLKSIVFIKHCCSSMNDVSHRRVLQTC